MGVMEMRRSLLQRKIMPSVINLCPAATGTEILDKFTQNGSAMEYLITGLDPNQDYTLQATWTQNWNTEGGKRLYLVGIASNTMIRPVTDDSPAPITKSVTTKPDANGTLRIWANKTTLTNVEGYAASMINIMLEVGSVAHPYVPYKQ